jgi:hypothetical protein
MTGSRTNHANYTVRDGCVVFLTLKEVENTVTALL